jgi:DNA-binding response OmpR family regulator
MSDDRLKRTLRIPQRELDALLDMADQSSANRTSASKRRSRRWTLRSSGVVLTIQTQAGGHTHFLVAPRNLSSSGMGVIHGGFIHIGTRCIVSLRTRAGGSRSIPGKIVKCRLMRGNLHDIGVEFGSAINPMDFVAPGDDLAFNVERVDPATLTGKILIVDDDRAMQKLLAHYIKPTRIEATYATDADAALQCLADEPDMVFVDIDLPGKDGIELVRAARERHFMAPLLALTAHTAGSMRARFLEAGGTGYLTKPITQELLHQAIAEHLSTRNAHGTGALLHSTLASAGDESELVVGYIEDLRKNADLLATHIEQKDLDALRRVILKLRGTAAGHGFDPITPIADAALASLVETQNAEASMRELQSLIAACHRARPSRADETESIADAAPPAEKTTPAKSP